MRKFVEKRTWIREHLGDISSDAQFLSAFAKNFSMKEDKAAAEMKQILAGDAAIEEEFGSSAAARHLALGQKLLAMMTADKAFGPASVVWRAMSQVKGLDQAQKVEVEISGPDPQIVRARIAALMANKEVQTGLQNIGLEVEGDQMSLRAQWAKQVGLPVSSPSPTLPEAPAEAARDPEPARETDATRLARRLRESRTEEPDPSES